MTKHKILIFSSNVSSSSSFFELYKIIFLNKSINNIQMKYREVAEIHLLAMQNLLQVDLKD